MLGGAQSNPLPVVSGVPQGSVLGSLLFLVYIDGASNAVLHSKIAMYADDIALYSIIKNPNDYTYLQRDITSLCSWLAINHLTLNLTKCCYMPFSRKCRQTLPDTNLYVGDSHALAKVDHYKYLGLNFYSDLSWCHHVGLICKKTRKLIGMFYRNFYQFSSPYILVKLYKSLIRPHMEYACPVRCSSAGCPPFQMPPGHSALVQDVPRTVCPRAECLQGTLYPRADCPFLVQNVPPSLVEDR